MNLKPRAYVICFIKNNESDIVAGLKKFYPYYKKGLELFAISGQDTCQWLDIDYHEVNKIWHQGQGDNASFHFKNTMEAYMKDLGKERFVAMACEELRRLGVKEDILLNL